MLTHKDLVKKMLKIPEVRAEYDAQAEEFALLDELLRARQRAGLTQAEVAARMGTKTPAVARLEGGGGRRDAHRGAGAGGGQRSLPGDGAAAALPADGAARIAGRVMVRASGNRAQGGTPRPT